MNKFLSTTALVVALGLPALALAQTTAPAANPATQQQANSMSGFLTERGELDVFASDLIGHAVHARRIHDEARSDTGAPRVDNGEATTGRSDDRGMMTMSRADIDGMENIGEITDIVLSGDGKVQAIVIGVGGFLGMGEQDVAVTMDQISFASGAEDRSEMYIVVNTGADRLKDAPVYDRTSMKTEPEQTGRAWTGISDTAGARTAFAAPNVKREGYKQVAAGDVSTEMLMGAAVYDLNDNEVGTVTDMIIGEDSAIKNVIIDFGGFLGMGKSRASLAFDELTILSTDGHDDIRLYVDATRDQIQDLPKYLAGN